MKEFPQQPGGDFVLACYTLSYQGRHVACLCPEFGLWMEANTTVPGNRRTRLQQTLCQTVFPVPGCWEVG